MILIKSFILFSLLQASCLSAKPGKVPFKKNSTWIMPISRRLEITTIETTQKFPQFSTEISQTSSTEKTQTVSSDPVRVQTSPTELKSQTYATESRRIKLNPYKLQPSLSNPENKLTTDSRLQSQDSKIPFLNNPTVQSTKDSLQTSTDSRITDSRLQSPIDPGFQSSSDPRLQVLNDPNLVSTNDPRLQSVPYQSLTDPRLQSAIDSRSQSPIDSQLQSPTESKLLDSKKLQVTPLSKSDSLKGVTTSEPQSTIVSDLTESTIVSDVISTVSTSPSSVSYESVTHQLSTMTTSESKNSVFPVLRHMTPFEEKLSTLNCNMPPMSSDSRLWKGNETREMMLPLVVSLFLPLILINFLLFSPLSSLEYRQLCIQSKIFVSANNLLLWLDTIM